MAWIPNDQLHKYGFRAAAPRAAPRAAPAFRGFGNAQRGDAQRSDVQRVQVAHLVGAVNQLARNFDVLRAENARLYKELAVLKAALSGATMAPRAAPAARPASTVAGPSSQEGGRVVSMDRFRARQAASEPETVEYEEAAAASLGGVGDGGEGEEEDDAL